MFKVEYSDIPDTYLCFVTNWLMFMGMKGLIISEGKEWP